MLAPYICSIFKVFLPYSKVSLIIDNYFLKFVSRENINIALSSFILKSKIDAIVSDTKFYFDIKEILDQYENIVKFVYGDEANDIKMIKKYTQAGVTGFCTDNLEVYNKISNL